MIAFPQKNMILQVPPIEGRWNALKKREGEVLLYRKA